MYRKKDYNQLSLSLPFGVKLDKENRWVKLADMMPWRLIEEEYANHFHGDEGQVAKSSRLAFGALYIQTSEGFTDAQTRQHIMENPYFQYFCGFEEYTMEPPFDASMMTHFRKRIPAEMLMTVTQEMFAEPAATPEASRESEGMEQAPKGTLILDATCCPADIRYPTDVSLLHQAREYSEQIIDALYEPMREALNYKKPRTYRETARKKKLGYQKKRRHSKKEIRQATRDQLGYLKRNFRYIDELLEQGASLTWLENGLYRILLIIRVIFEQQLFMYENGTHHVEGRIVSITQPHIRPIVRGKAHAPTEFGAKIAIGLVNGYAFVTDMQWDNFPEGKMLNQAANQYKAIFGHYPKVIIGDRAYCTRENRRWCRDRGIRLSGPRLGRKTLEFSKEEAKQIYQDSCERNQVEGVFGVAKRKYGLDRIMAKLPDSSFTAIAMVFFVMNMERMLRLSLFPDLSDYIIAFLLPLFPEAVFAFRVVES